MRREGGVRIVRAADDAHVRRKARRRGDFGLERSKRVPGLAHRREEPPPAKLVDHAREPALDRTPQVGVRADGGELGRGDAAQAPRPILRIGEERARGRELSRESALKVEDLAPEVEPARQVRRQRLLERRAKLVVFGRDVAVDVELIVDGGRRGVRVPDQHAGRAMRRDRNRLDGKLRAELLQRANEERPGAFRVEAARYGQRASGGIDALGWPRSAATLPAASNTTTFMLVLPMSNTATQPFIRSVQMEHFGERRRAFGHREQP